ncbi:phosphoribosylformylglycinamidine synthase [Ferrithrix thermotolerans DSM 19514]|uniref:Phosphoribosylformylglycinamidine synthase subunit PurL n=1 Tax=Ferrithrix thermotolerans DSM 19514 TaxID=1121881 RepID=A0A1M4TXZ0_9ACTN|nr:phosphoribosylformylglycinamidine synthase subunit PurL [Ferrithrix thermotolerans]SHE49351.1 phosphoribosylformylglycinamidine synthase [Ferrithrix thermotolerans DSM 19514]
MAEPLHIALGLTDEEFAMIRSVLQRDPNDLELAMYSVMWSEHCSYKSSRVHLRRLPTEGPSVIMGPGENAGVIDVGDGFALAIRMESHNHPSAIEPYQGAATGVGGILRDIFTVGARPVALLDSLWMGPQNDPKSRWIFKGVVSGISGYGNAVGVPTVGGETHFEEKFGYNPLVNVAAIGIAPKEHLIKAAATGAGNLVVLLGAPTGRDGIGGVSILASTGFGGESDSSKRPSVQVGDPFEEKKLIELCLDLLRSDLLVGIQDLGGAGLSCATSETAAKGGSSMDIYLDKVPRRESCMEPFEVMISESQERMLAIVHPSNLDKVLALAEHWEVQASVVGEVKDPERWLDGKVRGILRVYDHRDGELLAEVPAGSLADEAPLYDRERREPEGWKRKLQDAPSVDSVTEDVLNDLLKTTFDPSTVYRQYDHQLFLNTIVGPGEDAALLRIGAPGVGRVERSFGVSVDGNPRWCVVHPRRGAAATVVESVMNIACVGAKAVALVDCLNFGNPTHPEVMWQLSESIDGVAEACEALGVAVVGGNVSLYNEANGVDIDPTPTVTTVGLSNIPSLPVPSLARSSVGSSLYLIGESCETLSGSAFAFDFLNSDGGNLFTFDYDKVTRLRDTAIELFEHADAYGVETLHNVSSGGVLDAVREISASSRVGCVLYRDKLTVMDLLGEKPDRLLVTTTSDTELEALLLGKGLSFVRIGYFDGGDVLFA